MTAIEEKRNRRHSSIRMATADGSPEPWEFTTSAQATRDPSWSPDGRSRAFRSARGAGSLNRVYLLPMNGGETSKRTNSEERSDELRLVARRHAPCLPVFFTNPRGSTGYGEKFARGVVNNWAGRPIRTS